MGGGRAKGSTVKEELRVTLLNARRRTCVRIELADSVRGCEKPHAGTTKVEMGGNGGNRDVEEKASGDERQPGAAVTFLSGMGNGGRRGRDRERELGQGKTTLNPHCQPRGAISANQDPKYGGDDDTRQFFGSSIFVPRNNPRDIIGTPCISHWSILILYKRCGLESISTKRVYRCCYRDIGIILASS